MDFSFNSHCHFFFFFEFSGNFSYAWYFFLHFTVHFFIQFNLICKIKRTRKRIKINGKRENKNNNNNSPSKMRKYFSISMGVGLAFDGISVIAHLWFCKIITFLRIQNEISQKIVCAQHDVSLIFLPGSILSRNGPKFRVSKTKNGAVFHFNRMCTVCSSVFDVAECTTRRFANHFNDKH